RLFPVGGIEAGMPVLRPNGLIVVIPQEGDDVSSHLRLVFNDQYLFHGCSKNRKHDGDGGTFSNSALQLHLSSVQFGAAFHQQQAEAGAGSTSDITSTVKGLEQLLLIFFGDANPAVTHCADRITTIPLDCELDYRTRFRIFYGIG